MTVATLRRAMYKLDMKLRRSKVKPKAHQTEPKRMSFTEIMHLITKPPPVVFPRSHDNAQHFKPS